MSEILSSSEQKSFQLTLVQEVSPLKKIKNKEKAERMESLNK